MVKARHDYKCNLKDYFFLLDSPKNYNMTNIYKQIKNMQLVWGFDSTFVQSKELEKILV